MADAKNSDDVKALTTYITFLYKQMREATARAEALRYLLESKGVFSHQEYERVYAEALRQWNDAMGTAMTEALEASNLEELQRLVEKHEGTKH